MRKGNKRKNRFKMAITLLVVLAIALGISYYFYDKRMKEIEANKLKVILKDDKTAEINSEVKLNEFVDKIVNGELINGEDILDTSKLGKSNLDLIIKNKDNAEERKSFSITIVDTTAPAIEAKKEITSYIGKDINLLDGVKIVDNSKETITPKVVGSYDKNKVGKYSLKYEASDSSGNKAEYDFILSIISDPNNYTFTTSKGFSGKVVNGVTYIDGVLIANKTYSLPASYGSGLTSTTQSAFNKMKSDASGQGFDLYIGSGYRSYSDQKYIYNNYVKRDGQAQADTYSARAGHSEHQSGLAFDVCERETSACISSGFDNTAPAKWINENCYKYGLILRYPKGKDSITGYMYESWHFRYVGVELATKLYNNGDWITLEEYYGIDSKYK